MSFVAGTDWLLAQVRVFLAGLGGGALLGLCWRLYAGLFRPRTQRRRDWLLPDLIFSLGAAALLVAFWFAFTDGGLRPRDFLWLACGFFLFRLLPPLRLPRIAPAAGRVRKKAEKADKAARTKPKEPRPDPLLRLVARWEAGARRGMRLARLRIRRGLARRKKAAAEDGPKTGNGQEKL